MNYFIAVMALLFFVPVLYGLAKGPSKFRKQAKQIIQYTSKKGYVLANPSVSQIADSSAMELLKNPAFKSFVKGSEDIGGIREFENGTEDPFAFTCILRSKEVMIFNFSVPTQSANTQSGSINYKVAKIKNPGLPRFHLGKHSIVDTVENIVDKIAGKPKSDIHVDPQQFPEFSEHFWLKGPDGTSVLTFLSADKIRFLESAKLKGTLATNAVYLVYFEFGIMRSESDFDSFIATAESIIASLL